MMKNRALERAFKATRLDSVLFELYVEGGHEMGRSGRFMVQLTGILRSNCLWSRRTAAL